MSYLFYSLKMKRLKAYYTIYILFLYNPHLCLNIYVEECMCICVCVEFNLMVAAFNISISLQLQYYYKIFLFFLFIICNQLEYNQCAAFKEKELKIIIYTFK